MGSTSRHGRATINPTSPCAVGVCDRCGFLHNLETLRFQFDWAGTSMINRQIRVCGRCYDAPQEQLRTIILPPDPPPVYQPRPEPYLVDEINHYTLGGVVGPHFLMFRDSTLAMNVELVIGDAPDVDLNRRMAAGWLIPGTRVAPDATPDAEWRYAVAKNYLPGSG